MTEGGPYVIVQTAPKRKPQEIERDTGETGTRDGRGRLGRPAELRRRGASAVVVDTEPTTFTEAPSSLGIITLLATGGFPTYLLKRDQPLEEALSQKIYGGQG